MNSFTPLPGRDAYAAIRGFVYQVERTILAWVLLPAETVLMCECGEDIDYIRRVLNEDGSDAAPERLLEQVKYREDTTISLRSTPVLDGIASFIAACGANPGQDLRFRLFTNALTTSERGVRFPRGYSGIEGWNAVRDATVDGEDLITILCVIRQLLRDAFAGRVPQTREATTASETQAWQAIEFLDVADDQRLVSDLVSRFEFATGNEPVELLRQAIERHLQDLGHARSSDEAGQLYQALFVHVFHTVSRPGEKRLDSAALQVIVQAGTLAAVDRALLTRIEEATSIAAQHLTALRDEVSAVRRNTEQERIEAAVMSALQRSGILGGGRVGALQTNVGARVQRDEPPIVPAYYVPRPALEREIATRLDTYRWTTLSGLSGAGKTQLARTVYEGWPSSHKRWIALRQVEHGPGRHLIEQLTDWYCELGGDLTTLPRHATSRSTLEDVLQALAMVAVPDFLIVLDDIPDTIADPVLLHQLTAMAALLAPSHGRLIATAQQPSPTAVGDALGSEAWEMAIPPLDASEVEGMLRSAGAPITLVQTKFAGFLAGLTRGHPQLVAAVVRWLERNQWSVDDVRLDQLIAGEPLTEVRKEARRKLRVLLDDDEARSLLDRLALAGTAFRLATVTAVGRVSPAILQAEERFHDLVGPWIRALPGSRYEVTPLLQYIGKEYLPDDVQLRVHGAIALVYLQQRSIDDAEAVNLCSHLFAARDWGGLALAYAHIVMAIEDAEQARQLFWTRFFFKPEDAWPQDIPISLRIVLRALQIRQLLLAGVGTEHYDTDLGAQVNLATDSPDDQAAVGFALFHAGVMRPDLPAETRALRALESARAIRRAAGFRDVMPVDLEAMVWAGVMSLHDLNDVREFAAVLRRLTADERRHALTQPPGPAMAIILADRCYADEAAKLPGDRDWEAVLAVLDELAAIGQEPGGSPLLAAAARARAIVLADYLGQVDEAVALLADTPPGDQETSRFVLAWTQGRILLAHERPLAAVERFREALAVPLPTDPMDGWFFDRQDALAYGMQAAARTQHWDEAAKWAADAIRITRRLGNDPFKSVELLGELGWIHWQTGDRSRSSGAFCGALRWLMAAADQDSPRFNEVAWKLGHVLGWIASMAMFGRPPGPTAEGQDKVEPASGFLYRENVALRTFPRANGLSGVLSLFGQSASAADCLGIARWAFAQSAALAATHGALADAGIALTERGMVEAFQGNFDAAIEAALKGVRLRAASALAQLEEEQGRRLDTDENWRALTQEERRILEGRAIFEVVIWPACCRLLSNYLKRARRVMLARAHSQEAPRCRS